MRPGRPTNTLHPFHFNPEVGSLPTPQRVNALNEAGMGRNLTQGSRGMRSFIIGKGLAFRDFQSRLQHFGPRLQPRRDCLTARRSQRPGTRHPVFQYPGSWPGTRRNRATNPGDSLSRGSTGSGLCVIILSCSLGSLLPQWERADLKTERSLVSLPNLSRLPFTY